MLTVYFSIGCAFKICSMLFKKFIMYVKMFKSAAFEVVVALYMQLGWVGGKLRVKGKHAVGSGLGKLRVRVDMQQVQVRVIFVSRVDIQLAHV